LQDLGRMPEAIERLTRAIAASPYDPSARFGRGATYAMTGQNALSREDLVRVLELDTSGTQYGNLATGFLDILDGLDARAAEAKR
jgi:Flp pilus assembly protein TadD